MKAGITGHQHIGSKETMKWVTDTLENIIFECKINMGNTSLAIGADQLFAEILRKKNIPYNAVIPSNKYEFTFEKENVGRYFDLLNSAQKIIHLAFDEPNESAFYEAGKCVSDLSDIVIAIWDGQRARGLGGTGDIVEYTILKKKRIIQINPLTHKISWL